MISFCLSFRYKIGGHSLPKLREFAEKRVGMDVQYHTPSQVLLIGIATCRRDGVLQLIWH